MSCKNNSHIKKIKYMKREQKRLKELKRHVIQSQTCPSGIWILNQASLDGKQKKGGEERGKEK